ncbi:MAG TPA: phosphoglucomutase/phosphomannomutase family protein [Chloroflexota bacterium]|nr:phosphoglucomutase/phosphomannomutase family protein [Chloroflexota bacterium]
MSRIVRFGTDGWRAIVAEDYTYANVRDATQGTAEYVHEAGQAANGVVVGYDTRFASEHFAEAVAEVLAANGIKVYLTDTSVPTPVISFTVLDRKAGGAIVITSSHNPWTYNGFKYKPEYAGSASQEVVDRLEEIIEDVQRAGRTRRMPIDEARKQGLVQEVDPKPAYYVQVGKLLDLDSIRQAGLRIVADPIYGAGRGIFKELISGGKTTVNEIRGERNPYFGGVNPEPILPNVQLCCDVVKDSGADLGLCTDGDSDRIGIVDDKGRFVDQLQVMGLLTLYLLEVRGWRGPIVKSVTTTSMCNRLAQQYGVEVVDTPVGFKFIGPEMIKRNAMIGGEESGGFGFANHIPERDAIVAGLFISDLTVKMGKPLSEVIVYLNEKAGPSFYHRNDYQFPEDQRQTIMQRLADNPPKELDGTAVESINHADGFKYNLADNTWLMIRFSGTEPLLRIYTETNSPDRVQRMLALGKQMAGI